MSWIHCYLATIIIILTVVQSWSDGGMLVNTHNTHNYNNNLSMSGVSLSSQQNEDNYDSSSTTFSSIAHEHPFQQRRRPLHLSSASTSTLRTRNNNSPMLIGYAHDAKSGKAEQAILDGINVIIWSFLHLDVNEDDDGAQIDLEQQQQQDELDLPPQLVGQRRVVGRIRTDLDIEEIRYIRNKYDHVVHLAAFGGWNGPHPSPILSGKEWCHVFLNFNQAHDYVFDGIDWDYEGHDDTSSPTSQFTIDTLDIIVDFSVEAKRHGLIVTMAPAESYLDSTIQPRSNDAQFSLHLNLPPRAWTSTNRYYNVSEEDRSIIVSNGFSHAGRQCYAYILAKAGVEIFDWISIQLYEAYSPFSHDVYRREMDTVEALMMRMHRFVVEGYTVTDLPSISLFPTTSSDATTTVPTNSSEFHIKIPISKLVLGIANGWADGFKFYKGEPSSIKSSYDAALEKYGEGYLGVMFWTIEEEGSIYNNDRRMTYLLRQEFKGRDQTEL